MKRLVGRVLVTACVLFTAMMLFSLPFAYQYSPSTEGLDMTVGMLGAGLALALLQGVWFSGVVVKRMRFAARLAGFALTGAPTLYLCGWLAGWFPHQIESAVGFFAIFLVIFAVFTAGYAIYFRKTAGSYQQALDAYRAKATRDR